MILDRLENAGRYESLNPMFAAAFEFLRSADLKSLAPGRHELQGDGLYAVIMRGEGKGKAAAKLEMHHDYINVQYVIEGTDWMGWKTVQSCTGAVGKPGADLDLSRCRPEVWVETRPGAFCIFFPEDAHAPMGGKGALHKVVVKVPDKR